MGRWHFWIDRGGTFTDVVARTPEGAMVTAKLLSEDPGRYSDAAVAAIRQLTGVPEGPLSPAEIRIGTTVATNALLERKGEPVLLAITRGFEDALVIGTQDRPDIFARHIVRPPPLFAEALGIDERVSHEGEVLRPLDLEAARKALEGAHARGLSAIAIVLLHAYRHPAHEAALANLAREIGFTQVSASHEVGPLIKLVGRGDTSVVDAYLSPVLRRYVEGFEAALGGGQAPLFMQSNGGLASARSFRGKDAILSGPAGGIVGMAETARQAGFERVIGFDMGGTSTDVSLFAGRYERDNETIVAGARIRAPMLRIHTVAAGGGSVCRFEDGRLMAGPESAGAVPGPACYRRRGPLTVTDCNVALGKIQPQFFPSVFGPGGDQPLDPEASKARLAEVAAQAGLSPEAAAEGLIAIAAANMSNAIKAVSIARGHDVTRFALACFGGAGGQHACLVADALGIETVIIHPLAGVLSAYGMGIAARREVRERTVQLPLEDPRVEEIAAALGREARAALDAEGLACRVEHGAHLRTPGSDSTIEVPLTLPDRMRDLFWSLYRKRFGYVGESPLLVEMLRAEAISETAGASGFAPPLPADSAPPVTTVEAFMAGTRHATPVHDRAGLAAGAVIEGPALIVDPVSTTVLEPGWRAEVNEEGSLILTHSPSPSGEGLGWGSASSSGSARRTGPTPNPAPGWSGSQPDLNRAGRGSPDAPEGEGLAVDPIRLEIFAGLFMSIAEEMGAALRHSASSVNIRERLDFSCALFDADGNLIANAPHIPVHLGSMGESIRTVIDRRSADGRGILPGDVYALNAPYDGGTHLPDITVIQPVFVDNQFSCESRSPGAASDPARDSGPLLSQGSKGEQQTPAFFVAARGHHADVGGISPGSMPPDSRSIEEEGVILDNFLLVEDGQLREAELRALLGSGRWPARNIDQNVADLAAQVAACARGAEGLRQTSADYGVQVVEAYMGHVQDHAEAAVRRLIPRLPSGSFEVEMDSGAMIRVSVEVDAHAPALAFDFAGTSDQQPDNFNAPFSVVRAAVLYVMRTLIDVSVPLNDGFLRAVTIRVPEGSMLNPRFPAAVVAGNVETSQAVTDALFGALGALAGSQGTMNNFTFGNDRHQYYETIAGGSGAGPGFDGTAAVQTHMTNSRLTDPEVLEARFPVLVDRFSIRRGSGGAGAHRGGDGAIRRIRFREAMQAGILSNRRRVPPRGLAGGGDGAPGINRIERADGRIETLSARASVEVQPGDVFVIETPGGGGFG